MPQPQQRRIWAASATYTTTHNSGQHQIPNPQSEARDGTHILMDTTGIHFPLLHNGKSLEELRIWMNNQINNDFGKYIWYYAFHSEESKISFMQILYFSLRLLAILLWIFFSGSENEGKTKYLRFLAGKWLITEIIWCLKLHSINVWSRGPMNIIKYHEYHRCHCV